MNPGIATARGRTVVGALLGVAAAFALSASVALAAPGNNGTIKVHDSPGEPSPEVKNEPHVGCPFHFHFFFADAGQTGEWWVMSWPPTGGMTPTNLADAYGPTDANGEWVTDELQLPAGHYKLYWTGDTNPGGNTNLKHKAFWVDESCQAAVPENPPEEGGPAAGEPTPLNGATGQAPTSNSGTNAMALAVLLSGGSAIAFVLLRPIGRGIRRD